MPITEWSDAISILELEDEPALSEDMDAAVRRIESAPEGATVPDLVVDLRAVTHMNSSNIAQLLRLRKRLIDRGGRLRVCSVRNRVWSVLLVTGLDQLIDFTDDVTTSIASLQIDS